ncbi:MULTISPECIES: RcnB family protein [unclassified Brenneria]|uniref:RcnB family protein n=1 Tax=unclassified Brenneria TaxID=2634434 RepID=UPI0029C2D50D|nr:MULTISPECIES: RcnB family protein [unclassified Brenneria]MDX5626736.1 RcnB family protein [Brenneria sp. L3-3Z]MDX5693914.1 RcnB family protein [Brenneria sp. L4-2C]
MTKKTLALTMSLLLATSSFSGFTFAQGMNGSQEQRMLPRNNQDGGERKNAPNANNNQRNSPNANNNQRNAPSANHNGEKRGQTAKQAPREQRNAPRFQERERFVSHGNNFRKGHPVPQRFRGDDYRVNDWRARGLREPPSGQHWAYIDGNYVLIAAATGIITTILLNSVLNN